MLQVENLLRSLQLESLPGERVEKEDEKAEEQQSSDESAEREEESQLMDYGFELTEQEMNELFPVPEEFEDSDSSGTEIFRSEDEEEDDDSSVNSFIIEPHGAEPMTTADSELAGVPDTSSSSPSRSSLDLEIQSPRVRNSPSARRRPSQSLFPTRCLTRSPGDSVSDTDSIITDDWSDEDEKAEDPTRTEAPAKIEQISGKARRRLPLATIGKQNLSPGRLTLSKISLECEGEFGSHSLLMRRKGLKKSLAAKDKLAPRLAMGTNADIESDIEFANFMKMREDDASLKTAGTGSQWSLLSRDDGSKLTKLRISHSRPSRSSFSGGESERRNHF